MGGALRRIFINRSSVVMSSAPLCGCSCAASAVATVVAAANSNGGTCFNKRLMMRSCPSPAGELARRSSSRSLTRLAGSAGTGPLSPLSPRDSAVARPSTSMLTPYHSPSGRVEQRRRRHGRGVGSTVTLTPVSAGTATGNVTTRDPGAEAYVGRIGKP